MAAAIRILYVDDEPDLLNIGKLFLEENRGFSVECAVSGKEALALIAAGHYDAIVSDYQMPGMDGISLLKKVRAKNKTLPFILFTGRGREEVVIEALNEGANFYLQKGGEPESQFTELAHKIRHAVKQGRAEEALVASVEELREASSRYEALIAASNTGAWEYHADSGFLWCSPEYFSMLGRDISDFNLSGTRNIEQTWIDLLHPDDRERTSRHFDTYLSNPEGMYEQHFRMLHTDGHWLWILSRGKTVRDAKGKLTGITVGTHIDVTDRKRAEEALKESETRYHEFFNTSRDCVFITSADGRFIDFNDATLEMFGYDNREEMFKLAIASLHAHSEGRSLFLNQIVQDGYVKEFPVQLKRRDGTVIDSLITGVTLKNPDGTIKTLVGTARDITERKRMEEALRVSEEKYRLIADNTSDNIWIFDMDMHLQYISPSVEKMKGFTVEESMSLSLEEMMTQESLESLKKRFCQEMELEASGKGDPHRTVIFETEEYCKSGATILAENSVTLLRDAQGNPFGILGISRDITERKRVEEALQESEERYHEFFTTSRDCVFITSPDGRFIDFNDATLEMFGYDNREEMFKVAIASLYAHSEGRSLFLNQIVQDGYVKEFPVQLKRRDGTVIDSLITGVPLKNPDGTIKALVGTARDITERKLAEQELLRKNEELSASYEQISASEEELRQNYDELTRQELALQESEEKYRTVFENTGTATVVVEENNIISLANNGFAQLSGFSKEDIDGKKSWTEFVVREDLERMLAQHRLRRQNHEEALTHYEFRFITKSGDIRNIYLSIDVIPGTKKSVASLLDITGRKRVEEALKESEERYRHVVEDQTEFICRFLPDGTHIFVNESYCRYFGLNQEEIIGTRFQPAIHPEDRERVARLIASLTVDHPLETIDQRIIMPDGSTRWQRWVDRAIFRSDGSLKEYQSVGRDITENKQVEERLRESEERLHLSIDGANLGLWDMNLLTGEMVHNQRWAEMLGFSMDELEKPSEWWGQRVHPDDYQNVLNLSNLHRSGKAPFFDAVYRMKHKNGEWRWVHSQGKVISRDSNGVPLRLIGINQDITGQKMAEEEILKKNEELEVSYEELTATSEELHQTLDDLTHSEQKLRESEEKYRTVFENTGTATVVLEESGIISLANTGFAQLSGFSKDDIEGKKSWTEFVVKEELERMHVQQRLRRQNHEESLTHYEFRFVTKSGDIRTIYLTIDVIPGTKKSVASLLDITGQKKAGQDLQKAFHEYRNLLDQIQDVYYRSDPEGNLIIASRSWATLLGYDSIDECIGKPIAQGFYANPEERKPFLEAIRRDGYVTEYEVTLRRKDGSHVLVSTSSHYYYDDTRTILGVEGTFRDITERKRAEEALGESKEFLNKIINTISDPIHVKDRQHRVILINDVACRLFNLSREEIIGKTAYELFPRKEMADISWQKDEEVFRTGEGSVNEETNTYATGKTLTVLVKKTLYTDTAGNQFLVGITTDITERKRAAEALQHLMEFQDSVITNARVWLSVLDQTGRILRWNTAAEEISGYRSDEVTGKNEIWKLLYPQKEYRKQITDTITRIIRDRKYLENFETTILSKQGAEKVISWNTRGIPDATGKVSDYIAIGLDVTDRKQSEEALRESEEKFRGIFDSVNDGIQIHEIEPDGKPGKFIEINEVTCRMLQYSRKELLERGPLDLVTGYHNRSLDVIIGELSSIGHSIFETEHRRKDGTIVPVEINSHVVNLKEKRIIVGVVRDIAERKRIELALKESEQKYRNVVEDQTEFICRFLPDSTHVFVNDAYCRYFNRKREDIIGHRFRLVIHPEDREKVTRHIASITPEHPVMDIDQRIIMPDGSTRWQRWSDRAIFGEDGRVIEYQSVGRDITEQKKLEKDMEYHALELSKFSTSLAAANKKLTLLSGITRHDITNQLTVLQGYLRILEKKQPDTAFSEHFKKINISAQRISAMLQFTKEYEKIGVNAPAWQDCRTLVDTAAKQAPLGKIMVKNDLPAGTEVFADPLVVKVFYNLMENALRYGGQITTIRLSVQETGEDHLIVCEDDGDGVPAKEKEKIFERGFGKNTGLGLALAREVLAITGITIRETGGPGKGARFEMVVPKGMYRMTGDGA